jgi:hypothetical protein
MNATPPAKHCAAACHENSMASAVRGWVMTILLGLAAVGVLHVIPTVRAPALVALATPTTALGALWRVQ